MDPGTEMARSNGQKVSHAPSSPQSSAQLLGSLDDGHADCAQLLFGKALVRWLQGRFDGKRSEEHTSELQSLMRISYAVFCLKKKNIKYYIAVTSLHHTCLEMK